MTNPLDEILDPIFINHSSRRAHDELKKALNTHYKKMFLELAEEAKSQRTDRVSTYLIEAINKKFGGEK